MRIRPSFICFAIGALLLVGSYTLSVYVRETRTVLADSRDFASLSGEGVPEGAIRTGGSTTDGIINRNIAASIFDLSQFNGLEIISIEIKADLNVHAYWAGRYRGTRLPAYFCDKFNLASLNLTWNPNQNDWDGLPTRIIDASYFTTDSLNNGEYNDFTITKINQSGGLDRFIIDSGVWVIWGDASLYSIPADEVGAACYIDMTNIRMIVEFDNLVPETEIEVSPKVIEILPNETKPFTVTLINNTGQAGVRPSVEIVNNSSEVTISFSFPDRMTIEPHETLVGEGTVTSGTVGTYSITAIGKSSLEHPEASDSFTLIVNNPDGSSPDVPNQDTPQEQGGFASETDYVRWIGIGLIGVGAILYIRKW